MLESVRWDRTAWNSVPIFNVIPDPLYCQHSKYSEYVSFYFSTVPRDLDCSSTTNTRETSAHPLQPTLDCIALHTASLYVEQAHLSCIGRPLDGLDG